MPPVTNTSAVRPTTNVKAPVAQTPSTAVVAKPSTAVTPDTNATTGVMASVSEFLKTTGVDQKVMAAVNAKSSDEVVAALSGGIAQLALERIGGIGDLDKKLAADFEGTVKAHVTNETAQKALIAVKDIFGQKVASNLISAGVGSLSGTALEMFKNPASKELFLKDKQAFGLELLKAGGKNFGVALLTAWGTGAIETHQNVILEFLGKIPLLGSLLRFLGILKDVAK